MAGPANALYYFKGKGVPKWLLHRAPQLRLIEQEAAAFQKLTGLKPTQREKIAAALGEVLPPEALAGWKRTDTGQLSSGKDALRGNTHWHPALAHLERWGRLASCYNNFGPKLAEKYVPETGRVYGSTWLLAAKTGRASSSQPNLQNMPRGDFRRLFRATAGRRIVKADYSGVELRAAALEAQESTLLEVFQHPAEIDGESNPAGDPHRQILELITGAYSDEQRTIAKGLNFGTLYGCGPGGLNNQLHRAGVVMPLAEAANWLDQWRRARPALVLSLIHI